MSLLPAKHGLACWEATTFRKRITVLQGDAGTSPVNYTGYTGTMPLYSTTNVVTPLYTLSSSNGGITFGGTAGTIDLFIPEAVTTTFDWTSAIYQLVVVDAGGSGDYIPLLWGQFQIRGLT